MSFLSDLLPFEEAVKSHGIKTILPTSLDTATLRQLEASLRRQSFFSAQTLQEDLLQQYFNDIASILNPVTEQRADRVTPENPQGNVTTGYNEATARLNAKELLQKLGYQPAEGERGTLKDLSSDTRINLVIKTNTEMSQGAGNFIQGNDPAVLDAFPAQELVRFEQTKKQRDWHSRWLEAAVYSGDTDAARVLADFGRMVARKDSPIWDAIGSSELFDDGLDNPYPPYAFNSGMWVQDVSFATAEGMGLVTLDNIPEPQALDIESLFKATIP
jgi:hypothetical protein